MTAVTMTMTMTMTQQQGRHYCSGDSAEEGCGSGGAGGKETCAAPPPGQKCTTMQ